MRRLYGHLAHAGSLPGPVLCGEYRAREAGPAIFYCGKCVERVVEDSRSRPVVTRWSITHTGELNEDGA